MANELNQQFKGQCQFIVSGASDKAGNMYNTVKRVFPFLNWRPQKVVYLVGSDTSTLNNQSSSLIKKFGSLKQAEQFFHHMVFLIHRRDNRPVPTEINVGKNSLPIKFKTFKLPSTEISAISSTAIRSELATNSLASSTGLSKNVYSAINELGLYGVSPSVSLADKSSIKTPVHRLPAAFQWLLDRIQDWDMGL